MGYFTTKEIAEATGLSTRQIQYYIEKNTIKAKTRKSGRGRGFLFTGDDILKFLIAKEAAKFGMSLEKISNLLYHFPREAKNNKDVERFIDEKLFLEGKFYNLTIEYPFIKNKEEYIYGHIVYKPDSPNDFQGCFFKKPPDKSSIFYGYKFEEGSLSTMLLDIGEMLKIQYDYLQKNPGNDFPDDDIDRYKARRKG